MEQNNRLGIHLSQQAATVALVAARQGGDVQDGFVVSVDPTDMSKCTLAAEIVRQTTSRGWKYDEVFVALDCPFSTQHSLRSEFTEYKQIQSTIKFDVEEAVATDASNLAVASCVTRKGERGSNVTAFTADRSVLTGLLEDLQAGNLDPTTMEPDLVCLARFIEQQFVISDESNPMFVLLSQDVCYMIRPAQSEMAAEMRSFVLGSASDRTGVLTREIPITKASWSAGHPVDQLFLGGMTGSVDLEVLHERIGLEVKTISLTRLAQVSETTVASCPDPVRLAAACAATHPGPRHKHADYREDFAPFLGKRMMMQRMLRIVAVSAAVIFVTVGIQFYTKASQVKTQTHTLHTKLAGEYRRIMQSPLPDKITPHTKLDGVIRSLKKKGGIAGEEDSVPSKLTFILDAFNKAMGADPESQKNPNAIDLNIKSITLSSKTIKISGDTKGSSAGREYLQKLLDALNAHEHLEVVNVVIQSDGNRDAFTVNLELKGN
ncbi:MAG: hypothetical protein JXA82_00735 [Sedimentisphaerales bacterium]|nr:hypothetical protein [Sedimentisphaerales bacterium]